FATLNEAAKAARYTESQIFSNDANVNVASNIGMNSNSNMAREVSDLQSKLKSIKGMLKMAVDGLSKKQYHKELPKPSIFKRIAFE
uniref:Uncharacterized protein n=1 Tax=Romanomermis culicivorax TaxID=13658 RepID=A0A915IH34_ROMCU